MGNILKKTLAKIRYQVYSINVRNKDLGIIFFAGIYGVGKSTLSSKISKTILLPEYSASELISMSNNEEYGKNKFVSDVKKNQVILAENSKKILQEKGDFLMSGHFCIFNSDYSINILPTTFFDEAQIKTIILLVADIDRVLQNLNSRDAITYKKSDLLALQKFEIEQAEKISQIRKIPFHIYNMEFSDNDISNVIKLIHGE